MPLTRRWVARIFSPGEYMLTNVIITRSAPEIGEEARGVFHKALRQTLRGDAAYQAMGRENLQPRRVHVDECHHYAIGSRQAWVLITEGKGRLVTMMAVGDQQFLVGHQCLHRRRIHNLPEAMDPAVLVGDLRQRRAGSRLVEYAIAGALAVRIQHEQLPEMCVRVA